MADFLVAPADFDRRRGWEPLGHASLFAFLVVELGLSTSSTFWRKSAAELLEGFQGSQGDRGRVAAQGGAAAARRGEVHGSGCSSSGPAPGLPSRRFSRAQRARRRWTTDGRPHRHVPRVISGARNGNDPPARDATRRDDVEPLSADLRRLHVTVSRQFLKKLDAAREGLSHTIPGATTEQVLEAGARPAAREAGQGARAGEEAAEGATARASRRGARPERRPLPPPELVPAREPPCQPRRTGPRSDDSRSRPVRRAVWQRDGGRCSWPLDSGGVCGSTHRLELDHVVPGRAGAGRRSTTSGSSATPTTRWRRGRPSATRCVERYARKRS